MSLIDDLYGEPARSLSVKDARPMMQAITKYANLAYISADVPETTRLAILSLPVRNALSLIERASLDRMVAAEEPTLIGRIELAIEHIDRELPQATEPCLLRQSLYDLHRFLRQHSAFGFDMGNASVWY
jgi:hypothetical protein